VIWKSFSVQTVNIVKCSTSPCVNLQILKRQDARLITGNALSIIFQYTQAAVPVSLALVV
jgi:hypothetical protein